jgi:hypothetical protein
MMDKYHPHLPLPLLTDFHARAKTRTQQLTTRGQYYGKNQIIIDAATVADLRSKLACSFLSSYRVINYLSG